MESSLMYRYRSLSPDRSFRVLVIQPNQTQSAPVRINLEERKLPARHEPPGHYEALSYVWGSKDGDHRVLCGDQILHVTKNCYDALQFLRLERQPRTLWVDAICINQQCKAEKVHQIELMGDIYACAIKVLVWLGQGDPNLLSLMQKLTKRDRTITSLRAMNSFLTRNFHFKAPNSTRWLLRLAYYRIGDRKGADMAADRFLIDDWFQRAWTLQELCFARECSAVYANNQVSWRTFTAFLLNHMKVERERGNRHFDNAILNIEFLRRFLDRLIQINSIYADGRDSAVDLFVLKFLVLVMRQREATEPHDHIYAFRALLQELEIVTADVDYDTPIEQLFEDFTFQLINQSRCLLILEHIIPRQSNTKPRLHGLPSWVPDYSQKIYNNEAHDLSERSPQFTINQPLQQIPGILKLQGQLLNSVTVICDRLPGRDVRLFHREDDWASFLDDGVPILDKWFQTVTDASINMYTDHLSSLEEFFVLTCSFCYLPDPSPRDVSALLDMAAESPIFARLAALGSLLALSSFHILNKWEPRIPANSLPVAIKGLRNLIIEFQRFLQQEGDSLPFQLTPSDWVALLFNASLRKKSIGDTHSPRAALATYEFLKVVSNHQLGKKLFITQDGIMGLTYGDVQKEDRLVLLNGSRLVMLLRETGCDCGHYHLVGPAEVVGVSSQKWAEVERLEGVQEIRLG